MDGPGRSTAPKTHAVDGEFDLQVTARLRAAFARSRHPMLIADDHRRWVSGNAAACELLGLAQEAVAWHTMDDFTPPSERPRLKQQWAEFLTGGEAGGRYELYVADHKPFPTEFGAVANVVPGRHLALFILADEGSAEEMGGAARVGEWRALMAVRERRLPLSKREREVMTLAAAGGQSGDMAQRLFLSPETIKSHIQNAMAKLGAHTRAHAVAIALVTGQIAWSDDSLPSG